MREGGVSEGRYEGGRGHTVAWCIHDSCYGYSLHSNRWQFHCCIPMLLSFPLPWLEAWGTVAFPQ